MTTYGNLIAIYETHLGLGSFLGPLIGGIILDNSAFSTLSGLLTGLSLGNAGALLIYCSTVYRPCGKKKSQEYYKLDSSRQWLLLEDAPKYMIETHLIQSKECDK
ncbi:uncharacterized protein LOC106180473 [Lingula anatina]|uniref:Uncharacterized protein LOC106180473 n=1 Tax=Lingula anatina TaxID=7574 RepID=A0A1S3KBU8_LINAN|nr:uncharacterized protein LOC106180473 [Lingula anatina]|eukprot:XP_013419914.1 uncharacterized protein LOC106180473 [Lingula anatina]